ncbi:hypothetical protein MMC10_010503 [Thelotrema lepadinum]|nr:hypothetical protein [Thelotrema lepadinum]
MPFSPQPEWPLDSVEDDEDDYEPQKFRDVGGDSMSDDDSDVEDGVRARCASPEMAEEISDEECRLIARKLWEEMGKDVVAELTAEELRLYSNVLQAKRDDNVPLFVAGYVESTRETMKFVGELMEEEIDKTGHKIGDLCKAMAKEEEDFVAITQTAFHQAVARARAKGKGKEGEKAEDWVMEKWRNRPNAAPNWGGRRDDGSGIL